MMRAYDSVNNLGKKERDYLATVLLIRKNSGRRSPIHITTQERHGFLQKMSKKLSLSVAQTEEKRFLRNLFAFRYSVRFS